MERTSNGRNLTIRRARPDDHAYFVTVIDDWFGGRRVTHLLHKLFFVHFRDTCFIAENRTERVGVLVGFFSQTNGNEAYIHVIGVHPRYRKQGIAGSLYRHFFSVARQNDRTVVRSLTSPDNFGSIAFHRRLGFLLEPSDTVIDGLPVHKNYHGPNEDRVLFVKYLAAEPPEVPGS